MIPQVKYPKPQAYRNPYVPRGRGRPRWGARVTIVAALIKSNPDLTLAEIAAGAGCTRERVRQIVKEHGLPYEKKRRVALEWDCPGCGAWIKVGAATQATWTVLPAHCRECSKKHRSQFCKRGHLRTKENTTNHGACKTCYNQSKRCVAEVRTCKGCGGPLPISREMLRQIARGEARGEYHRSCNMKRIGGRNKGRRGKP